MAMYRAKVEVVFDLRIEAANEQEARDMAQGIPAQALETLQPMYRGRVRFTDVSAVRVQSVEER